MNNGGNFLLGYWCIQAMPIQPSRFNSSRQSGSVRMLLLALLWLIFNAFPAPQHHLTETGFKAESKSWLAIVQTQTYRLSETQRPDDKSPPSVGDQPQLFLALFSALLLGCLVTASPTLFQFDSAKIAGRQYFSPLLRAPPTH